MPILNYTTKVPVDRTVTEITRILTKAKATAILSEYDKSGNIEALTFRVNSASGEIYFKLPVNVSGVEKTLKHDKLYKDDAHARRVAWRILKDWIEAQMAIVYAQMAELPQVFLPYAKTSNGETVYQKFEKNGFLQLTQDK